MFSGKQFLKSTSLVLLAFLAGPALGAAPTDHAEPRGEPNVVPPPVEPVYRAKAVKGKDLLVTRAGLGVANMHLDGVAFFAVVTNEWPSGLVPLFAVERTNRFELRRRPPRGEENSSEPLCFGLPPGDEPDASRMAGDPGRWLESVPGLGAGHGRGQGSGFTGGVASLHSIRGCSKRVLDTHSLLLSERTADGKSGDTAKSLRCLAGGLGRAKSTCG